MLILNLTLQTASNSFQSVSGFSGITGGGGFSDPLSSFDQLRNSRVGGLCENGNCSELNSEGAKSEDPLFQMLGALFSMIGNLFKGNEQQNNNPVAMGQGQEHPAGDESGEDSSKKSMAAIFKALAQFFTALAKEMEQGGSGGLSSNEGLLAGGNSSSGIDGGVMPMNV